MRRHGFWTAIVAIVMVAVVSGFARGAGELRRETPARRPYIVEIGDPRPLTKAQLEREMRLNSDLRDYIGYYGFPEVPDAPWDAYEVRLYYLRRRQEVAFGRAFVAPTVTDFGVLKYLGPITDADRERLARRAAIGEDAYARAASAAERAERAAERAAADSRAAARAAERAAAAAERMEREFYEGVRK